MASFLSVLPILFFLYHDCQELKLLLIAFSLLSFIGRIGCFWAGCCSGKECPKNFPFKLTYRKKSIAVDKYQVKYVYPTILFEIFIQFMIFLIVKKSIYGVPLYGILNSGLLLLTYKWRLTHRMGSEKSNYLPIISLLVFTVASSMICLKTPTPIIQFNIKPWHVIISILMGAIVSNDINFNSIKNDKNNNDIDNYHYKNI